MKYEIQLGGKTYEVEVELAEPMTSGEFQSWQPAPAAAPAAAPTAAPAAPAAPAAAAPVGAGEVVSAPMPGNILKVSVTEGQSVKEGELLVILEAMKMENEIFSPKSGTVTQVLVSRGSTVDTGAAMVVIG